MRTSSSIGSEWLFWGKLGSKRDDGSRIIHPLLCHMIDVAAVAQAMWQEVLSPAATRRLADRLGLEPEAAGRWIAFWAGLHDLGKASPAFQSQYEPLYRRLVEVGLPCPSHPPETAHGLLSAYALPDVLTAFGLPRALAKQIATVLGGHHGILALPGEVRDVNRRAIGSGAWEQARRRLAEILAEALSVPSAIEVGAVDNPSALSYCSYPRGRPARQCAPPMRGTGS